MMKEQVDSLKTLVASSLKNSSNTLQGETFTNNSVTPLSSYLMKIPFLGKIIKKFISFYNKNGSLKLFLICLTITRKIVIICSAIIGVAVVFNAVNFSFDNIIAGLYGMGATYMEMLSSLTLKIFNWFLKFFDVRVVPDIPTLPTSKPSITPSGNTRDDTDYWKDLFEKYYKNEATALGHDPSWSRNCYFYKPRTVIDSLNIPTWLWYTGAAAISIGLLYAGYKVFVDPNLVNTLLASDDSAPRSSSIVDYAYKVKRVLNPWTYISAINYSAINYLNPWRYFSSEGLPSFNDFLLKQSDLGTRDQSLYPYTKINPYDSWFHKWNLYLFGESDMEKSMRLKLLYQAAQAIGDKSNQPHTLGEVATSIGLGLSVPDTSSFNQTIEAVNLSHKFKNIVGGTPVEASPSLLSAKNVLSVETTPIGSPIPLPLETTGIDFKGKAREIILNTNAAQTIVNNITNSNPLVSPKLVPLPQTPVGASIGEEIASIISSPRAVNTAGLSVESGFSS
jgi:hypothetical protein